MCLPIVFQDLLLWVLGVLSKLDDGFGYGPCAVFLVCCCCWADAFWCLLHRRDDNDDDDGDGVMVLNQKKESTYEKKWKVFFEQLFMVKENTFVNGKKVFLLCEVINIVFYWLGLLDFYGWPAWKLFWWIPFRGYVNLSS